LKWNTHAETVNTAKDSKTFGVHTTKKTGKNWNMFAFVTVSGRRKRGFMTDREKYLTCSYCGIPLNGNDLVTDAYKIIRARDWAVNQLKILADMMDDRGAIGEKDKKWFADELRVLVAGLEKYNLKF